MVLNYSKRHDFCRGWSAINTISPEHGVLSFITMISPEDGLPSPWSLHRMVYHHHLSRGWSIITMISAEDGLSSPWYLHVMVHQWSIITSISIWWSIITMISQVEGLSTWSIKKRVYHHHDLSRGSIMNMISPEEGLSSTWSIQRLIFQSSLLPHYQDGAWLPILSKMVCTLTRTFFLSMGLTTSPTYEPCSCSSCSSSRSMRTENREQLHNTCFVSSMVVLCTQQFHVHCFRPVKHLTNS